jgi:hypothetical protein
MEKQVTGGSINQCLQSAKELNKYKYWIIKFVGPKQ